MWGCRRKSRIRGYGKHSLCLVLRRDARRWVWRCEDSCGKERGKGLHVRMTVFFLERRAQIRLREKFLDEHGKGLSELRKKHFDSKISGAKLKIPKKGLAPVYRPFFQNFFSEIFSWKKSMAVTIETQK